MINGKENKQGNQIKNSKLEEMKQKMLNIQEKMKKIWP